MAGQLALRPAERRSLRERAGGRRSCFFGGLSINGVAVGSGTWHPKVAVMKSVMKALLGGPFNHWPFLANYPVFSQSNPFDRNRMSSKGV